MCFACHSDDVREEAVSTALAAAETAADESGQPQGLVARVRALVGR